MHRIRQGILYYSHNIFNIIYKKHFIAWGRKCCERFASWCQKRFGGTVTLYEDGFIRSIGLGIDGSPSFSMVEDDVGIYYDATSPSKLENILNTYDFANDYTLMETARQAIALILQYHISKYNNALDIPNDFFSNNAKRVLIIAQRAGDASLHYGLGNTFTTDAIIDAAIAENPDAEIWLKVHPDALKGKKKSDIDSNKAKKRCKIIDENFNPISLLKYFNKVYTKTSQMGFEALLMGKECVCFGVPFYSGWGITDDRVKCERRIKQRSVEEVFAAAYILYTRYTNPYQKRPSDILDTIHEIVKQRKIGSKS